MPIPIPIPVPVPIPVPLSFTTYLPTYLSPPGGGSGLCVLCDFHFLSPGRDMF